MTAGPAGSGPRRLPPVLVRRPQIVAVLGVTVGLALLGGSVVPTPIGDVMPVQPSIPAALARPAPTPRPHEPLPTRPPIGEDGVMGGLVFGTAWGWLEPSAPAR